MPKLALADLLRPELLELSAYVPQQGEFALRLDANEAPNMLSEKARARLAEVAAATAWERYPDATARELRGAIANRCHVHPGEVLVGLGSDELITLLLTALDRPRTGSSTTTLLTITPTFAMYRMSARVRGIRVIEVPLDDNWDLAVDSMLRAIEVAEPNLIFVASPNNPTGTLMDAERLRRLCAAAKNTLVIIDEAYVDYARRDQLAFFRQHGNVGILRSLSKVGFAALRVGWLIGPQELITEVDKTRLPYNVPTLSQQLATLVLTELAGELDRISQTVVRERERVRSVLKEWSGVNVDASEANFLWLKTDKPADDVFRRLSERGILIQSFHSRGGRLAHRLRVTIGTRAQNDRFLEAFAEVL